MRCQIQWIDERGKTTPDRNEAVGFAVLGDRAFPICEAHAARITHFDGWKLVRCAHREAIQLRAAIETINSHRLELVQAAEGWVRTDVPVNNFVVSREEKYRAD